MADLVHPSIEDGAIIDAPFVELVHARILDHPADDETTFIWKTACNGVVLKDLGDKINWKEFYMDVTCPTCIGLIIRANNRVHGFLDAKLIKVLADRLYLDSLREEDSDN